MRPSRKTPDTAPRLTGLPPQGRTYRLLLVSIVLSFSIGFALLDPTQGEAPDDLSTRGAAVRDDLEALMDPTDPWGTLGAHVVAAKGARGARVARSLSVRSLGVSEVAILQ